MKPRAPMPGLAARIRSASIATEDGRCYCCADPIAPGVDLVVSVGLNRFRIHRAHLDDATVGRLVGKAAA